MSKVTNYYGKEIDFEAAVNLMDEDLREQINSEIAPCPDQVFFEVYAERHEERFNEEFAPYAGMAW